MGYGGWDDKVYTSTVGAKRAAGKSTFDYNDSTLKSTPRSSWKAHDDLDPKGVTVRESRDSDDNPMSTPITVLFDVTGSMGGIPRVLQEKLPGLMSLLLRKGYVEQPQVMFGAIGDATCDRVPLQIGQWESDNAMDSVLGNLVLEGGGGGQNTESYELAMYFMARHTDMDSLSKRGQKGYLFMIGDELAYPKVKRREVEAVIGDTLQEDISTEDMVAELQKKFEVYFIIPSGGYNANDPQLADYWKALFGQNVLFLDDPAAVCETIALTIGLAEDAIDLEEGLDDLREIGLGDAAESTSRALATVGGGGSVRKVKTDGALPKKGSAGSGATRL